MNFITIHSKGMNFITHSLHISYPNPFSVMLRLPISYPIPKKKKEKKKRQILVKVYNILSNYIPITFTYPFHTQYKKKKKKKTNNNNISLHIQRAWITYPFHYNSFEEHEVHYPLRTQYNDE